MKGQTWCLSVEVWPTCRTSPSLNLLLERNFQVVRRVGKQGSGGPASRKPGIKGVFRLALGRSPRGSARIKDFGAGWAREASFRTIARVAQATAQPRALVLKLTFREDKKWRWTRSLFESSITIKKKKNLFSSGCYMVLFMSALSFTVHRYSRQR